MLRVAAIVFAALLAGVAAGPSSAQVSLAPTGSPPAPVLHGPAAGLTLSGANVSFQWYAGAGQTNPVRYEICAREAGQACTNSAAAIFRPSGVLLPNPMPPQLAPPRNPRDPGFERPAGGSGSGSAPLSYSVALPIHFQGRRLQWSVTACIPDPRPLAFAGSPPELCSVSDSRNLTWALPIPTLLSPAHDLLLPGLTAEFSWDYANPQNVDHFLLCLAVPGLQCPPVAGIQHYTLVVQLPPTTRTLPAPQSFAPFMNESLHWTVAACNYSVGCTYQPVVRRFRVPIVDGSFDSIYPVTQSARCKNCHQMHTDNDTYKRHVALGRFTREDVPPGKVASSPLVKVRSCEFSQSGCQENAYLCSTCHTAATGFADNWQAAPSHFTLDSPMNNPLCRRIRDHVPYNAGFFPDENARKHLRNDSLILWAVGGMPDLGVQRWQHKVDLWFQAGAPCPCEDPSNNARCANPDKTTTSAHGRFVIPTGKILPEGRIRR